MELIKKKLYIKIDCRVVVVVAWWIARRSPISKVTGSSLPMFVDVIFYIIYFENEGDRKAIFYRYIYIIKHVCLNISGVQNRQNYQKSNWTIFIIVRDFDGFGPPKCSNMHFSWFVLINPVPRVTLLFKLFDYLQNWPSYNQKTVKNYASWSIPT